MQWLFVNLSKRSISRFLSFTKNTTTNINSNLYSTLTHHRRQAQNALHASTYLKLHIGAQAHNINWHQVYQTKSLTHTYTKAHTVKETRVPKKTINSHIQKRCVRIKIWTHDTRFPLSWWQIFSHYATNYPTL